MSNNSTDRALLYGLLAMQLGFASRDELTGVFTEWLPDKSTPFHELLSDRFAFSAEIKALLDALVEEHLKHNGGSPEKSLSVLSSIGSLQDDLATLADTDLQASLSHVGQESHPTGSQPTESHVSAGWTNLFDEQARGESGRFRLIRLHAKGGLGQVSVAVDKQLSREVALKELQSHVADDRRSRDRFVLEAEITGSLEHPGIVPVYGAGHYADGRPYYAMRFIRGDSLKEAIEEFHLQRKDRDFDESNRLELRKLLRRFVDVCDAVEYAHSRGVLHRDLKPGNIMLGRFGETLVVDWGLAKTLHTDAPDDAVGEEILQPVSGSGSHATKMGSTIGTPGYMSPEQAAGKIDELGPASDVYSLGATLYCLLTGKPPYQGESAEEILSAVRTRPPERPRERHPSVSKPLEAICLKAMARSPNERYGTPQALAEDIERWLADEPVSVLPDPAYVRLLRWLRQHRAAAATIFTGLAATALTALLIVFLLADSNAKLAKKEADAVTARDAATKLANTNSQLAKEAQRQSANILFTQARQLLSNQNDIQGFRRLLQAMESAPVDDVEWRNLMAREIAAWSRDHMHARAVSVNNMDIGDKLGDDRLITYRILPSEASDDPQEEQELVAAQIVDATTFEPVSPILGGTGDVVQEFYDEEEKIYCVVEVLDFRRRPLRELEPMPTELNVPDDALDRAYVDEYDYAFHWCWYQTGSVLETKLLLTSRAYSIAFEGIPIDQVDEDIWTQADLIAEDTIHDIDFKNRIVFHQNAATKRCEIWSLTTGEQLPHAIINSDSLRNNGSQVANKIDERVIEVRLNPQAEPAAKLEHSSEVVDFDFSLDGSMVVSATKDRKIHVWWRESSKLQTVESESEADSAIRQVFLAGSSLVATTESGVVHLWRVQKSRRKLQKLHSDQVTYADGYVDPNRETQVTFLEDNGIWIVLQNQYEDERRVWTSSPKMTFMPPQPIKEGEKPSDVQSQQQFEVLRLSGKLGRLTWDYADDYIISYSEGNLSLHNLREADHKKLEHPTPVTDVRLVPSKRQYVTLDENGRLRVWNFDGAKLGVTAEALPGNRRVFTANIVYGDCIACWQNPVDKVYEYDQGQVLLLWELPPVTFDSQVGFSAYRNFLAVHPKSNQVLNGRVPQVFSNDGSRIAELNVDTFSVPVAEDESPPPDGSPQPAGEQDTAPEPNTREDTKLIYQVSLSVFSGPEYSQVTTYPLFESEEFVEGRFVGFSSDDQRLAIATSGYEASNATYRVFVLDSNTGTPIGTQIVVDGSEIYWLGQDGNEDRSTGPLGVFNRDLTRFAGAHIAEQDFNGNFRPWAIWDLNTGEVLDNTLDVQAQVVAAEFSPDGQRLATGSQNGMLNVWDADNGERLFGPVDHVGVITSLVHSPNGEQLVVVTSGQQWQIRDATTGESIRTLSAMNSSSRRAAGISADGKTLVAINADGLVQQWDLEFGIQVDHPIDLKGELFDHVMGRDFVAVNTTGSGWKCLPLANRQQALPENVPAWLKTITTVHTDSNGILRSLTVDELNEASQKVQVMSTVGPTFEPPSVIDVARPPVAPAPEA